MARSNGKSEVDPRELDLEHELPPAEEGAAEPGAPENQAVASDGARLAELQNQVDSLRAERDLLLDRVARQQAEFDNARKRAAKEQQDYREYALAEALKSLLPVLDSFDHALQAPEGPEFRSGVELINRQFHDALAKLGIQPIAAEGEPFDPTLHQAVQMVETDEAEDNHVLDVLQRGYKLRDRLLRPAMVRVARNLKK